MRSWNRIEDSELWDIRGAAQGYFLLLLRITGVGAYITRGVFFFLMGPRVVGVVGGRVVYLTVLDSTAGFVMRACYDVLEYDREGGIRANDI